MRFFIFILFLGLSQLQLCQDSSTQIQPISSYHELVQSHHPKKLSILLIGEHYTNFTDILPDTSFSMAQVFQVSCSDLNKSDHQHFPYCKPEYQYKLPAIIYYDQNFVEHREKGSLQQTEIARHIHQYYPNYALDLDGYESYQDWLTKTQDQSIKAIYFYKDEVPLWWKQLTLKFHEKCAMAQTSAKVRKHDFEGMIFVRNENEYEYNSNQDYKTIAKLFQSQLNQVQQKFHPFQLINTQIEQRHYSQLKNILETNQWLAIHYRRNSIQPFKAFQSFYDTFKGFFKIVEIDCSEFDCRVKQCPSLHIYSYGKKTNPLYIVQEDEDVNNVVKELIELMPGEGLKQYQPNQVHFIMQKYLDQGKYLIVWAYNDSTLLESLMGATLALEYEQNFKFMFFKDPEERIKKQLNIDKLPKIIAFGEVNLESGENRMFEFHNELNYRNLVRWLDMMREKQQRNVISVQSHEEFERICYNQCMIVAVEEKSEIEKADVELGLPWVWVDVSCQSMLKRTLKLRKTPSLIFYDKKKLRYGVSDIETKNVVSFWKNNKKKLGKLDDELELQNCKNQKLDL